MTGPYPGNTYISVPQAGQLTGAEVMPLLQSGRNRWTTASNFAALVSGIAAGVLQIDTGTGITGGPITSSGTIYIAPNAITTSLITGRAITYAKIQFEGPSTLLGNPTGASAVPSEITLGTGLSFSGNVLYASGGGGGGSGSVTQVSTGSGLLGGPVTSSGTLYIDVGAGLGFSGNTLINLSGAVDGVTSVAAAITGSGLSVAGSPITGAGTLTFSAINDLGAVEAISTTGYAIRTAADTWVARPLSGAANRIDLTNSAGIAGNTVIDISATYTGQATINTVGILNSGTWNASPVNVGIYATGNLPFINIQSCAPSTLLGNPTGATATPSLITLGANLSFSGTTLVAATGTGGAGTVTQISTGTGLTGGPITSSGTILFATIPPSSLWANVSTATNTPVVTTLGAGLGFSGTTIVNTSGAVDGVSSIATGTGLTGGTITSTGTISFASIAAQSLWTNVSTGTAVPVITTLGVGLAFSGTTIVNTSGAVDGVSSIATGTGLTGGTITSTGTISFASIAAQSLWTNVSTGTAVPVVTTLGIGLAFSGTTIINTSGAVDGVSSVAAAITGSGLSVAGSPITSAGTLTFSAINDLGAVEALAGTGYAVRTAADTWTTRGMLGTANQIIITNTGGVAGATQFATPQDINTSATPTFASVSVTSVALNSTAVAPSYLEGVIFYDSGAKGPAAYFETSAVTMNIGQETWVRTRNETGTTISNGRPVYLNSSKSGLPTIALATATSEAASLCIGLATMDIANSGIGYVTIAGVVNTINTISFSAGASLFLSTAGGTLTTTAASAPNFRSPVGVVVVSDTTAGSILVRTDAGRLGNGTSNQFLTIDPTGLSQEYKTLTGQSGIAISFVTGTATWGINVGAGLAVSGNTIISTGTGAGTVTQINSGSGLTGGPITSVGTLSIVLSSGLSFSGNSLVADVGSGLTFSGNDIIANLGSGLGFSGNQIINTSGSAGGGTNLGLVYAIAAGNIMF